MKLVTYLAILLILIPMIMFISVNTKRESLLRSRSNALPEVIDLIISGLQSGMSISETLESLGKIGPKHVQEDFTKFAYDFRCQASYCFAIFMGSL